uniref:C2H2-type domain-containing protein n=1 Tax=Syphacia muris TaxID=451379 RepID=A0A0N5AC00_9BILA
MTVVKIAEQVGLPAASSRNDLHSVKSGKSSECSRSQSRSKSRSKSRSRSRSRSAGSRSRSASHSRSRSPSKLRLKGKRRGRSSKSRSPRRRRSRSSSSRDTYDSFKASPVRSSGYLVCRDCDRTDFDSVRELSEHEIRAHDACMPCAHCNKEASSVQKLVDHMKRRHGDEKLICDYCKENFSSKVSAAKDSRWEEFRAHVYKECLKEKMYSHERSRGRSNGIAQRGRGRCPHGPPVRCKNFPRCPGVRCYYFHGYCRYDTKCVKKECPFDHTDRPRVCLSCLRDTRVYVGRDRNSRR